MTFTRALVRPPASTFADGLTTAGLGAPDLDLALAQHEAYVKALEACGLSVTRLPADDRFPDSTFVEDTAVLARGLAVLCRPGAPSRAGEVEAIRTALKSFFPSPVAIEAPERIAWTRLFSFWLVPASAPTLRRVERTAALNSMPQWLSTSSSSPA